MTYQLDGELLCTRALNLRGLGEDVTATAERVRSVLAMVGRHSASSAEVPAIGAAMQSRAFDFDSRAEFLELWNRCWVQPTADPAVVGEAVSAIRTTLDESWLGDVSRGELLTIEVVLAGLDGAAFDAVIADLSDEELYRWFHEFDGVRGGNLSEVEEGELFAAIVARGSAQTSWRLAQAERGTRLHQITAAVAEHPNPIARLEYLLLAARDATNTDHALAALRVLDSLDSEWQSLAATRLGSHRLDQLADTLADYVDEIDPSRDSSIPVEFLEGVWDGVWEMGSGVVGLTIQGLWDRHAFRENWAGLGGGLATLFKDPAAFVSALIDLEGLRANPTHWAGSLTTDVGAAALTGGAVNAARSGKLGTTLNRLTTKLDDLTLLARFKELRDVSLASRLVRGPNGLFGDNPVELRTQRTGGYSDTVGGDVRAFQTEALGGESGAVAFFARRTGVAVQSFDGTTVEYAAGLRFVLRPSNHGAATVEIFDVRNATVEKLRFLERENR